jgi:hypothetical protein
MTPGKTKIDRKSARIQDKECDIGLNDACKHFLTLKDTLD